MKEVEFRDRVPTNPGRVRITHVSGDLYDMERADNPTETGTALNKAAFDSIVKSRLTGRYYTPNVARNTQSSRIGITANPIPKSGWTSDGLTKAKNGSYTAESSSTYISGAEPHHAFDANTSTSWMANASYGTLMLDFGAPVKAKKIKLMLYQSVTDVLTTRLQGSNDKTNWTNLFTTTDLAATLTEYSLETTGDYRYYQIFLANESGNGRVGVVSWELSEYDVNTYKTSYTVDSGFPVMWDIGQRVFLQAPASVNTLAVASNTLNGVTVNTILQPNKRYELRYTGSAFAAKEV